MKKGRDLLIATTSTLHQPPSSPFRQAMQSSSDSSPSSSSDRYSFNPTLQWNPQLHHYFLKAYGSHRFSLISAALTRPSRYSCIRVNSLRSTSDAVIEKLRSLVNQQPQPPSNAEDEVVNPLKDCDGSDAAAPFSKCRIPGLDYVVFVWGSGPHRIDYRGDADAPPKEVIVSRKCAEAVLRGAQVYVPGIVACSAHVEEGDTVAVSVAVEQQGSNGGWSAGMTRGTVLQGSQTDPYHIERSGLYIGQGVAMLSRAGMFRVPQGVGVDMKDRVVDACIACVKPTGCDRQILVTCVLEGEIFLQNLPSIIAAHALDPQMGERILDMCAAPGGKTTAIAILMKDKGEVIATDRSHNKVLDIQKLAAELGLSCIKAFRLDAVKCVCQRNDIDTLTDSCCNNANNGVASQEFSSPHLQVEKMQPLVTESLKTETLEENDKGEKENGRAYLSKADIRKNMRRARNGPGRNQSVGGQVDSSKGFSPGSFDRVLLDAPCSALGLRPRLFAGEETIESLRSHAKYQRKMFDQAVQLARPGGVIVYSTCTINPGENEALVRYALDKYKYLSLAPQHPRIGGPGLVGSFEFPDGYVDEWLRPGEEDLVQRFDPSSPLDTIGFFIAKFAVGSKDT